MRISDWSSDVCSSDLSRPKLIQLLRREIRVRRRRPDLQIAEDLLELLDREKLVPACQQRRQLWPLLLNEYPHAALQRRRQIRNADLEQRDRKSTRLNSSH